MYSGEWVTGDVPVSKAHSRFIVLRAKLIIHNNGSPPGSEGPKTLRHEMPRAPRLGLGY